MNPRPVYDVDINDYHVTDKKSPERRYLEGFEWFQGYGVMGLPFRTGHVLALRRWARSSIGPPYTSIWHRDPAGRWTFWSTEAAETSCNRYAGVCVQTSSRTSIELNWLGDKQLVVTVPEFDFMWNLTVDDTAMTRLMRLILGRLPWRFRTNYSFLKLMGPVGGRSLRVGSFNMVGKMPNGQTFIAAPSAMWMVTASSARLGDVDFGPPGPLDQQAALGDFLIPQRGIVAAGSALFEELDPSRHSNVMVASA